MAQTINADDGVISGSAGLKSSSDGTGVLGLQTNGTTRLTIDASGNMGLGVTPSAWVSSAKALQIGSTSFVRDAGSTTVIGNNYFTNASSQNSYLTTNTASAYVQASGAHQWFTAPSGTAGNTITFTQAMTLNAAGELLVGTTTATYTAANRGLIELNGTGSALYAFKVNGVASGYLLHGGTNLTISNDANGPTVFLTNATERARITSGGEFLFNTTTANSSVGTTALTVKHPGVAATYGVGPTSTFGNFYVVNASGVGVYLTDGGTSWTGTSDERHKTDLVNIENAAEKVSTLRAVTGRFNYDDESVSRAFLIAQDVEKVFPQAVDKSRDDCWGLSYTDTIPLLVAAIKEQQAMIKALEAKVAALEAK